MMNVLAHLPLITKWTLSPFSDSRVISTLTTLIDDTANSTRYDIKFIDIDSQPFIIIKNNVMNDEIIDQVELFSVKELPLSGKTYVFHTVKYGIYFSSPYDSADLIGQVDQIFNTKKSTVSITLQPITTIPSVSLTYMAYLSCMGTMSKTFTDIGKILKREIKAVYINSYTIKFMLNGQFIPFLSRGEIIMYPSDKYLYFCYSNNGTNYGILFANINGVFIGDIMWRNQFHYFDNQYINPLRISYTGETDINLWISFFKFITNGII